MSQIELITGTGRLPNQWAPVNGACGARDQRSGKGFGGMRSLLSASPCGILWIWVDAGSPLNGPGLPLGAEVSVGCRDRLSGCFFANLGVAD